MVSIYGGSIETPPMGWWEGVNEPSRLKSSMWIVGTDVARCDKGYE